MLIIASKLLENREVVAEMQHKTASLQDMQEVESAAKDELAEVMTLSGIQREHLLSLHSIEDQSFMDKLKPLLQSVADKIARPIDTEHPEMGYTYTRNDGETVRINRWEFWRAINKALQDAIQGA